MDRLPPNLKARILAEAGAEHAAVPEPGPLPTFLALTDTPPAVLPRAALDELLATGLAVVDRLFSDAVAEGVRREVLSPAWPLREAGMRDGWRDRGRRGDRAAFVRRGDPAVGPCLASLLGTLDAVRRDLGAATTLAPARTETQVAAYPAGGRYVAHRDGGGRRLTVLAYANPGWRPGSGGELVAHLPGGRRRVVEPAAGRAVLFYGQWLWHEVLPWRGAEPRVAVTEWIY